MLELLPGSAAAAAGSGWGLRWGSAAAVEFVWNQLLVSLLVGLQVMLVLEQVSLLQEQESLSLSLADCSRMECSSQPELSMLHNLIQLKLNTSCCGGGH